MLLDEVDAADAFDSPVPGCNKPDWEGLVGWQILTSSRISAMLCRPFSRGLGASMMIKGSLPYWCIYLMMITYTHVTTHTHIWHMFIFRYTYMICRYNYYISKFHQCCFPGQGCDLPTAAVLCHLHSLSPSVHVSTAKLKWRRGRLLILISILYERGTMAQRKGMDA